MPSKLALPAPTWITVHWQQVRRQAGERRPLLVLTVLGVLVLLVVFGGIVRRGTESAGLRHAAEAARAQALWRCKLLRGPARHECLLALATQVR
ncbi:MAG: hypothetical protein LW768_18790 [Rubrivivax sp.]|jgi:hypothetical protein|nr:hypothetical protein [Rubrivivax sp.]